MIEAIDNIHEKYKAYKENEMSVWHERFTYKKNGKYARNTTNIFKFGTETDALSTIKRCNTASGYLYQITKLEDIYMDWVQKNTDEIIGEDERHEIKLWFKGAMGEYFFHSVLSDVKCLFVPEDYDGNFKRVDFDEIVPIEGDNDFGIDFIGIANGTPSVFQIKSWSDPNEIAPMVIYQKAYGDGCANNYINQHDDYNIFLCWFNTEKNGLLRIRQNKAYDKRALCVGYESLDESINKRNPSFWDKFYDSLCNIKEVKSTEK